MPTAFAQVTESIQKNKSFLRDQPKAEGAEPKKQIEMYVSWLDEQNKLAMATPRNELESDLLVMHLSGNESFLEFLAETASPAKMDEVRDWFSIDRTKDIPFDDRDPIFERYASWCRFILGRVEIATTETELKAALRGEEREDLLKQVEAAAATIAKAREIRREYIRSKHEKKDLKRVVKEYLGITQMVGEVSTKKLVKELTKKRDALQRRGSKNRVAKLDAWILDLQAKKQAKTTSKTRDEQFFELGKGAKKIVQETVSQERVAFDEALSELRGQTDPRSRELAERIDAARIELIATQDELATTALRLHDVQSMLERVQTDPKSVPRLFRKTAKLEEAIREDEAIVEKLRARELALFEQIEQDDAHLGAIARTLNEEIGSQQSLERRAVFVENELRSLKRLARLDRAVNIYCSFFHMSYPFILRLGDLVAGEQSGFDFLDVHGTSMSNRGDVMAVGRMLKMAGLPKGILKCSRFDTGHFLLSFKAGLSYGADFSGSFSAKAGLSFIYEATLSHLDTRQFMAAGTLKVVASAEVKGEINIPGFGEKVRLFRAAVTAELLTVKRAYIFVDQYHWAAWLSQRWANIAAMAIAFDGAYDSGKLDQPTPDAMAEIELAAQDALKKNPVLQDVVKDIAWFMEEDIIHYRETSAFSRFSAVGEALNELAALGIDGQRPVPVSLYRWKRDPVSKEVEVDESSELPVELTKKFEQSMIHGFFAVPGVRVDVTYSKNLEAVGSTDIRLHLNAILAQTFNWLTSEVDVIREFMENLDTLITSPGAMADEQIEAALDSVLDEIKRAAGGYLGDPNDPRAQIQFFETIFAMWSRPIHMLLKLLKWRIEWGWTLVQLSDGTKKWRPIFKRKIIANKVAGKNEREIPIETGVPGLHVDLGLNYELTRTKGEEIDPGTFAYWKYFYAGLMARRPFTGSHNVKYKRRVPIAKFVFGFSSRAKKRLIRNLETFKANSGRPDDATGEEMWAALDHGRSVQKTLWKMFLKIACEANVVTSVQGGSLGLTSMPSQGTGSQALQLLRGMKTQQDQEETTPPGTTPEEAEEKEAWLIRQLRDDLKRGVAGTEDFIQACKDLTLQLPADSQLPGSNEWRKNCQVYLFEEKDAGKTISTKLKRTVGKTVTAYTHPHMAAAKTLFRGVRRKFKAYLDGWLEKHLAAQDEGWTVHSPTKQIAALEKIRKEIVPEKYLNYTGHLNDVEALQEKTGATREQVEKALVKKGTFEGAKKKLEKVMGIEPKKETGKKPLFTFKKKQ